MAAMKRQPAKKGLLGRIVKWVAIALACLFAFTVLQAASVRWINPPFTAFMVEEYIRSRGRVSLSLDWAPAAEISPNLARAVLAAEDQRFYDHDGFDWVEIEKALEEMREGGRMRGASTISMQTARNLFLWSSRSVREWRLLHLLSTGWWPGGGPKCR